MEKNSRQRKNAVLQLLHEKVLAGVTGLLCEESAAAEHQNRRMPVMTDKDLRRLSRAELLELLLIQTKEVERLREKLEDTRSQLEERRLQVSEAGNLAEAVLKINNVMEFAQAAAEQYLLNISAMEEETRQKCEQMLESAAREAQRIREGGTANPE